MSPHLFTYFPFFIAQSEHLISVSMVPILSVIRSMAGVSAIEEGLAFALAGSPEIHMGVRVDVRQSQVGMMVWGMLPRDCLRVYKVRA